MKLLPVIKKKGTDAKLRGNEFCQVRATFEAPVCAFCNSSNTLKQKRPRTTGNLTTALSC